MMTPLDLARGFIRERGWSPIPVPFMGKNPGFDDWEKTVINESDAPEFFNGKPQNVGVLLGKPSRELTDVDLDCQEAVTMAPAFLPRTACKFGRASKRASHWLYIAAGAKTTKFQDPIAKKNAMMVEIRSTGCQTVLPGSTHPSGERIEFDAGADGEPEKIEPPELLQAVQRLASASLLARYWPGKGSLHDAALHLSGALLRSGFDAEDAAEFIFQVASVGGSDDPKKHAECVQGTAEKMAAGENVTGWPHVAECLQGDGEKIVKTVRKWLGCTGDASGSNAGLPDGVSPHTDLGNAFRLKNEHGDDLRFTRSHGWMVHDNARYEIDTTGAAARRFHSVTMDMLRDAANMKLAASKEADPAKREKLSVQADAVWGWAKKSQGEPRIKAALTVASTLDGIASHIDEFDRDAWILNCPNGALELRTENLRPHDRADFLTKCTAAAYDPTATAPTWLEFLRRIFDENEELISFIQRAFGYSLTGTTQEQCFFLCHGDGANGKSTLLEAFRWTLGDYAMNTPTDTLLKMRDQKRGPENDVARLRGARLVTAVESGEGKKLDEERIKRLTGGDAVTARFLFKEHFEYHPAFKIWLAVNDKPEIAGVDHGIWRRVRLIPFNVTIPEPEQDRDLPTRLQAEAAGILRWAVEGCRAWQEGGLQPPEIVLTATSNWRADTNIVEAFVDEKCDRSELHASKAGVLHGAFVSWCRDQGIEPVSQQAFGRRLASLGFKQERGRMGRLWRGLRPVEVAQESARGDVDG